MDKPCGQQGIPDWLLTDRRSRYSTEEDKSKTGDKEIWHGKLKNEEERRKFHGNFEEKATNLETPSGNSNEHWIHLKRCIQTTAEETIGYKESKGVKKPWVTGKMLGKVEKRRKWKNINTIRSHKKLQTSEQWTQSRN